MKTLSEETEEVEDLDPTLEVEEGEEQTAAQPVKKPEVKDDLREAVALLTKAEAARSQPKEEEPKTLSPEQQAELWAIYDPKKSKPDFMKKFFRLNPEATEEEVKEVEDLFVDMHRGLVRQSVKSSMNYIDAKLAKMQEELTPLREYYSQNQAKELRSRFNETFPTLADKQYDKLLRLADKEVSAKDFSSEEEYFKAVAEHAVELAKSAGAEIVLDQSKKPTKTAGTPSRAPRMSVGGTGGAGNKGSAQKSALGDDSDGVFDV